MQVAFSHTCMQLMGRLKMRDWIYRHTWCSILFPFPNFPVSHFQRPMSIVKYPWCEGSLIADYSYTWYNMYTHKHTVVRWTRWRRSKTPCYKTITVFVVIRYVVDIRSKKSVYRCQLQRQTAVFGLLSPSLSFVVKKLTIYSKKMMYNNSLTLIDWTDWLIDWSIDRSIIIDRSIRWFPRNKITTPTLKAYPILFIMKVVHKVHKAPT